MIEGFFWVWNLRFQDFFGWENLANFLGGWLDLIMDFFGIQINLKIRCSAHVSRPCRLNSANKVQPDLVFKKLFNAFWIFLRLGNSAWDFLGFNFGPGIFSGFGFFAPIWFSLSLELLQQVEPHFAAATNHLVCTGEFFWKSLSQQQNSLAATSRTNLVWFDFVRLVAAVVAAVVAAIKQILLQGCDKERFSQKFSSYTWLPSIQSFSTFLELRLRSGAGARSSFLDLSSEYDEICSVYVPLCYEVQLKKRMILNENWLLKAAGKLSFQLLTSRCLTNSEMTMGPVHQGVFWTFVPMQGKTRRDRLLVIQQDKLINPLVSLSIQLTSLVKNSTMTLNSIRGNRLLIRYSSGQLLFQPVVILLNEKNNKLYYFLFQFPFKLNLENDLKAKRCAHIFFI